MWQLTNDKNWEALKHRFDWVQAMQGVPQDTIHHAEGDVEVHTKMVVEALLQLPEYQELDEQSKEILWAMVKWFKWQKN